MYRNFLLAYIIIVGIYNIVINIARRKKKPVPLGYVRLQIGLNIILVILGLIYLIWG
ncbi:MULTISPECIES: hypothetical protein [Enterococcus]|uniref:Uncharacterized protein n=1 Tax=Enterococcus alishanensis TaxID=1303817 RepID=A0ABS6TDA9_9ENTE|nr:hypothetical protein [Enterococcus alishanensis]MBV7390893.1 hypothetical protein [Enterococcus alishanensis]